MPPNRKQYVGALRHTDDCASRGNGKFGRNNAGHANAAATDKVKWFGKSRAQEKGPRSFRFLSPYLLQYFGRSTRIRTLDPLVPNQVRYRAALHSEKKDNTSPIRFGQIKTTVHLQNFSAAEVSSQSLASIPLK